MVLHQLCLRAIQYGHAGQRVELLSHPSRQQGHAFLCSMSHPAGPTLVQVGKITWDLETTMPTLQANAHTFMFAMPGTQCFYSVLLASSERHAVLHNAMPFIQLF